jgi:hypothetical protein
MREDLLCMTHKVWEQVIHVTSSVYNVTKNNMKVDRKGFRLKAKPSETDEGLMK